jgi:hypothetical protein
VLDDPTARRHRAPTSMPDLVTVAQAEMRTASRSLVRVRMRLRGVLTSLDELTEEVEDETGDPDLEVASEMRRIAQVVLDDYIAPAILDLADAAGFQPGGEAEEENR